MKKQNKKYYPVIEFQLKDPVQWWKKEDHQLTSDKNPKKLTPEQKKKLEKIAIKLVRKLVKQRE